MFLHFLPPSCLIVTLVTRIFYTFVNRFLMGLKGTLSLHIKKSYMKPFDPLNTAIPSKKSYEFFDPPKKVPQVEISVLNRDKMVSMAPHFYPYWRQWSMTQEFGPNWRQWLYILIHISINGSRMAYWRGIQIHGRRIRSNSVAIDANLGQNVEPLTLIWIIFQSH